MSSNDSEIAEQFLKASAAQKSLQKLLVRLELIPENDQTKAFPENEPIKHYASHGLIDEDLAIKKVSENLKIQIHHFESADRLSFTKLLKTSPVSNIPLSFWQKIKAVPIVLWDNELLIAMANPLDVESIRRIEFDLQKIVRVVISREKEILAMLSDPSISPAGLDLGNLLSTSKAPELKQGSIDVANLESNSLREDISTPTVVRLVNKILSGAIQKGASDVHITPDSGKLLVRIRVDGVMRNLLEVPETYKEIVVARIKVLCGMDITERRLPQDGRIRVKTSLGYRDLRISTVPTMHGENLVARILSSDLQSMDLANLGMPVLLQKEYEKIIASSSKVVLVTGPTGSGKTSTLYASLLRLRDGESNIITIEDPIEYRLERINQIQVNAKVDMTFAAALRSVLRQDPDVIMVGEVRDSETASTVMQVAQTGHMVLSTLHTNSAAAAVTRLRDLGVPLFLIASSLGAVLAQRLLRKLCPNCTVPLHGPSLERALKLGLNIEQLKCATGCDHCSSTGYSGRRAVYSLLTITSAVAAAIREGRGEDEFEALARENGFVTLEEAALELALNGVTSLNEVERVVGPLDIHPKNIYLPVKENIYASNKQELVTTEDAQGVIPKRKILIVDDDENMRAIYQMVLEYEMFDVLEACDGFEALNLIYEKTPELIVLDLMMPKMSGIQMLEKLRADPRTNKIPVLVLTAASSDENEIELLKKGADDFVSKTARSEVIVARINRLLNRA
jgi:type II secretory ATPase GspE/PulE/Tfp pilus assembly ATPase PilB-like protein/ActR/RegA family two-component response regulator